MELLVKKIVYPGKSLGYFEGKIVFTDEGLPDELVKIEILKEKKNYIEAKTIRILKPSPYRVESQCAHFKACSGYQYIDYPFQLKIKESHLKEFFLHHLKINLEDNIIKPSPSIWGYRNKARLHIIWENNTPYLSYHQKDSFNEYLKIDNCFLLSPEINNALQTLLNIVRDKKMDFIKEVLVRQSSFTNDILLALYVNSLKDIGAISKNLYDLKLHFPIKGIVCITKDNKETLLFGENTLEEKIEDKTFFIGAESFFQINTPMLKEAIKDIKLNLKLTGKETIADLYCGVGTFGIVLAQGAKRIIAVESSPLNTYFLKKNIAVNNINNFTFHEGLSEDLIDKVLGQKVDILILDPPRTGLHSNVTKNILQKHPSLILYISCNPATLVRDLKILLGKYKLKWLQSYDFFPHTPHIETMCLLG